MLSADVFESLLDALTFGKGGKTLKISGATEINAYYQNDITKGSPVAIKSGWVVEPTLVYLEDGMGSINYAVFDPSDTYLAVSGESMPYLQVFKRSGSRFSPLSSDIPLPGAGYGVKFSPSGDYLVVGHWNSPFMTVFKRNGDAFNQLTINDTLPGPATQVDFDKTSTYLVVAHAGHPYVSIFKRNGDSFTKLASPDSTPTDTAYGIAFDPTDTYVAVAFYSSPYLAIYKRSGDFLTQLATPSFTPSGPSYAVAWDKTGTYLAVGSGSSPYLIIYQRSGDTLTKLSVPSSLPGGEVRSVAFSPNGDYLFVAHRNTPSFTIYDVRNNFAKLSTPSELYFSGITEGRSVYFGSTSNNFIAVTRRYNSSYISGQLKVVKGYEWKDVAAYATGNSLTNLRNYLNSSGASGAGIALEDGSVGQLKKVLRIWR